MSTFCAACHVTSAFAIIPDCSLSRPSQSQYDDMVWFRIKVLSIRMVAGRV